MGSALRQLSDTFFEKTRTKLRTVFRVLSVEFLTIGQAYFSILGGRRGGRRRAWVLDNGVVCPPSPWGIRARKLEHGSAKHG